MSDNILYDNKSQQENNTSPTGRNTIAQKDGSIKAPENVISTEAGARAFVNRLARAQIKRIMNYERVCGMFDGNPPYNPARMKQAGTNDMTNVNWKDAEAIFKAYVLAFWSLFNDVRYIADIEISFAEGKDLNAYWGKVLSEEWDKVIKLWPDFRKEMEFHQSDLVRIGLNCLIWFDEEDWRFKAINYKKLKFPDETPNRIEDISCFGVERTFTAQFLYQCWEKYKDTEGKEWDAKALEKILFDLANISDEHRNTYQLAGFMELQRAIRNGDIQYEDVYNDQIHMESIFQKEYDGKITHIMIHRSITTEKPAYFVDRQYQQMSHVISIFTLSPGEEYVHGAKGLGQAIFSSIEATTRLDCSLLDQGLRSGSLMLKSGATRGTDARVIKFVHGGVIDIGEAEVQQNTLGSNIAGTINTAQYFRQKVSVNNNLSGIDPASPDRDRTTKQITQTATKEARVQKNTVSHYYDQLDPHFCEIIRKMLHCKPGHDSYAYVKLWKDRSIARGVPEQLFEVMKGDLTPNGLPQFIQVFASRASGSGSQIADQTEVQSCMSILPTLGERGRKAVLQDYITAFRGYRYVARYFPPEDQQQQPVADDTIASLENNQLADGKQVVVSIDNNHAVHAPAHIRMLNEAMQSYTETPEPPIELLLHVDEIFAVGGPHLTRHMMFLAQDPTRRSLMENLRAQWAILANFGDMVKNNAQNARKGQQNQQKKQQQSMDKVQADMEVGMAKVQTDAVLKDTKLQADIQRDRERTQNKFLLEKTNLQNKTFIEEMKTVNELAREAQKEQRDGVGNEVQ